MIRCFEEYAQRTANTLQKTYIHTCLGFFCNGNGTWKSKDNKTAYNNTIKATGNKRLQFL